MTSPIDSNVSSPPALSPHGLKVALLQPQIAPNTGNIARLCVATGTQLHLVRPLGFVLSDRYLKRSAMDYWPRLQLTVHDDDESLLQVIGEGRAWLFTSRGERSLWEADFVDGDWLLFGSETHGLPAGVRARFPGRDVRIPQTPGERCLNLSTSAGTGLYEAYSPMPAPNEMTRGGTLGTTGINIPKSAPKPVIPGSATTN